MFVGKALQPGLSMRVCRKLNMPFVAFQACWKSTGITVLLKFFSNYHDQKAVKTSIYTELYLRTVDKIATKKCANRNVL